MQLSAPQLDDHPVLRGHPPVFVHGNPETSSIWGPLGEALDGRMVCLSPPGFGAPLPEEFPASMTAYRDWLVEQLTAIGEPVDLVGHDWGGAHVLNVAMYRPDLIRTWASDTLGLFHPDYSWHELARGWQTPGRGEVDVAERFGGDPDDRTARLEGLGFPSTIAAAVAAAQGQAMGRAVLALYRSAPQPAMADAGRQLPLAAARPGLALIATGDTLVGTVEQRRQAAALAGASTQHLEGLGHWWMLQDPIQAARHLRTFWEQKTSTPLPGGLGGAHAD